MAVEVCAVCKRQTCIKKVKVCEKVERILRRAGIKSANWIRPMMPSHKRQDGNGKWREIPFSSMKWDRENHENDFTESVD